jgi:hypothetical protein
MKLQSTHRRSDAAPQSCAKAAPSVVILDSGCSAGLVVISANAHPTIGTSFIHDGQTWVITHYRALSKAFVAEPAPQ